MPTDPHSPSRPLHIALVAVEASGDLLGADLIRALKRRHPTAVFAGVGGNAMREAGLESWHDYSEISVMGLVEVLRHLPRLLKMRRALVKRILGWAPDVVIGIDGPDFNLGLEKRIKRAGIPTVHYVSPSIWAWREGRAKKIQRSADRVLCLFPMEPPIYKRYGMHADFVGHPIAEQFALVPDQGAARATLGVDPAARVLAVLPGSRLGEIAKLGAIFLSAAVRLRRTDPSLRLLTPMANARCRAAFLDLLGQPHTVLDDRTSDAPTADEWQELKKHLTVVDGQSHEVMMAADFLLLASGTAALEGLLAKRPMVVAYRLSPATAFIVRRLGILKIDRFSLPNILANKRLVPELMQEDCTPKNIADTMSDLMAHPEKVAALMTTFTDIHQTLRQNASESAANVIEELVRPVSHRP